MDTDKKILNYLQIASKTKILKAKKKTIVFTTGCFDILHLGHIIHLNYCKNLGDILVVSIGNNRTVKMLKGDNRPIFDEKARARTLAALQIVDYVIISNELGKLDHSKLLEIIRPDKYIVPKTDEKLTQKMALAKKYNIKLIKCKRIPPKGLSSVSTTQIEQKLKDL